MNRVPSPTSDLIEELKDLEFKKEYGAQQAKLEFAFVLYNARTQSKLTQQALGDLLERSQPYVAKLEGGEANPTIAAIGRMLAALDLRVIITTAPIKPEVHPVDADVCITSDAGAFRKYPDTSRGMVPAEYKLRLQEIYPVQQSCAGIPAYMVPTANTAATACAEPVPAFAV